MWGVCLFSLLQIIAAVVCFWVSTLPELMGWCVVLVRIIGASSLLFILPALLVLKQRFQEIEGGELDEAGKY